jgi:hypothetical protein
MTKPAKAIETSAQARAPIEVNSRPMDIAKCRHNLVGKLKTAINEVQHSADVGQISQLVADIRALDFIGAMQLDPETIQADPRTPTRQEYDAQQIRLNAERVARESEQARVEAEG